MKVHKLLMYPYLGKYKRIEIILKEDLRLTFSLTNLDESKEEHLINQFVHRDNLLREQMI